MKVYYDFIFKYFKLILFLIFVFLLLNKKLNINIKVCICTIGKNENKYVIEFIEYYKKYGVDKIFLYDNNDNNGEKFDEILKKYISIGFVEIINFRGLIGAQIKEYKDCYKNNYIYYDWLIFIDMDEFIFLNNFRNIKKFLNKKIFFKCQRIQLNWIFHTDNNLLHYDNRSLAERFPIREAKARGKKKGGIQGIKSILKGNISIDIIDAHILSKDLISCDGFGNIKEIQNIVTNTSDFEYYYIDHYYCKSTEEFINKLVRGSVAYGYDKEHMLKRINMYFSYNDITLDKIKYIEKNTNLNLSKFRERIEH